MTNAGRVALFSPIWAGAIAAPVCWFTQQLLAGILVPQDCHGRPWLVPTIWIVSSLLLVAAMGVSWRALTRLTPNETASFTEQRARLIGIAGVLMPVLFLIAMTWQGVASMVYSGCEL